MTEPKKRDVLPEFLTWKEGKVWLCGWQRSDVLVQGPTEDVATERMAKSVCAWVMEVTASDSDTKHLPGPPPPAILRKWRAAHRRTHG